MESKQEALNTQLELLKKQYNRLVKKLNRKNEAHADDVEPLYREKQHLYEEIYRISAIPTDEMIARVKARLTPEERLFVRVLWNTPPAIGDLEQEWCDD